MDGGALVHRVAKVGNDLMSKPPARQDILQFCMSAFQSMFGNHR